MQYISTKYRLYFLFLGIYRHHTLRACCLLLGTPFVVLVQTKYTSLFSKLGKLGTALREGTCMHLLNESRIS